MEQDLFHEPYRLDLIPEGREIIAAAKKAGAFGTCISGAGPTLLSLAQKGTEETFISNLSGKFPKFELVPVSMNISGTIVSTYIKGLFSMQKKPNLKPLQAFLQLLRKWKNAFHRIF